jgi:chemosensory pili system protein ChpA (sensor histidine kinase/response regulator)
MPISVSNNPNIPLLLLDTLENESALIVDEIVKTEEIVIKPLGNPLQNLREFLGATILGDGNIVPVLDVIHLLKVQSPKSQVLNNDSSPTKDKGQKTKDKELTVLLVDDSPSVRQLTSNIIKNVGWTAIVAKDGLEALEILQDIGKLPDIILTDVEMPRMNGYELLASLKRQENLQAIPVIMITSRATQKHRQKAIDLGVSDYLTKPFEDTKLVEIIENLTTFSS